MSDRFDELVGEIGDPKERERLQRVHELLLSVEPPPEVSAALRDAPAPKPVRLLPTRRRYTLTLIAAALAAIAFGSGYVVGGNDNVQLETKILMVGTGEARGASATIELLSQDKAGNWPMNVIVRGLEPSRDREDFYELWLTRDGKLADSCGRFIVADGPTTVVLSVPYALRSFDGWVVIRHGSDEPLLST
jgi:hypothetical protein